MGLLAWGTTTKTNTEKIFLLKKKAVKLIYNLGYIEHTAPSSEKYKLLSIEHVLSHKLAIIFFDQIKLDETDFFDAYVHKPAEYDLRRTNYTKPNVKT